MSSLYNRTGKRASKVRQQLSGEQNHRCCYCHKTVPEHLTTLEHLQTKVNGGRNTYENLVMACISCNTTRSSYISPTNFYRLLHEEEYHALYKEWAGKMKIPNIGVKSLIKKTENMRKYGNEIRREIERTQAVSTNSRRVIDSEGIPWQVIRELSKHRKLDKNNDCTSS